MKKNFVFVLSIVTMFLAMACSGLDSFDPSSLVKAPVLSTKADTAATALNLNATELLDLLEPAPANPSSGYVQAYSRDKGGIVEITEILTTDITGIFFDTGTYKISSAKLVETFYEWDSTLWNDSTTGYGNLKPAREIIYELSDPKLTPIDDDDDDDEFSRYGLKSWSCSFTAPVDMKLQATMPIDKSYSTYELKVEVKQIPYTGSISVTKYKTTIYVQSIDPDTDFPRWSYNGPQYEFQPELNFLGDYKKINRDELGNIKEIFLLDEQGARIVASTTTTTTKPINTTPTGTGKVTIIKGSPKDGIELYYTEQIPLTNADMIAIAYKTEEIKMSSDNTPYTDVTYTDPSFSRKSFPLPTAQDSLNPIKIEYTHIQYINGEYGGATLSEIRSFLLEEGIAALTTYIIATEDVTKDMTEYKYWVVAADDKPVPITR